MHLLLLDSTPDEKPPFILPRACYVATATMATREAISRGCLRQNRAEKFPQLAVLSDRRPRGLDQFAFSRSSPVR